MSKLGRPVSKGKDKCNSAAPAGASEAAGLYMLPMSNDLKAAIKSHAQYSFPEAPYDSQTLPYHMDVKHWGDR